MSWWQPLLGVPFDDCNCWQLVRQALRARFDVDVPEHGGIGVRDIAAIAAAVDAEAPSWIAVTEHRPGDVLVFDIAGAPSHCGIVVADGLFLHTSEGIVSRVEDYTAQFWRRRLVAAYRHPDLA